MGAIGTSTANPIFAYPSQSYLDWDRNVAAGDMYVMLKNTAGNYELLKSTNAGTTWTTYLTLVRANIQEWSGVHIGNDRRLHWLYRTNESSEDRIYYRQVNLAATTPAWSAELKVTAWGNGGSAGSVLTGCDLQTVGSGGDTLTCIAVGINLNGKRGVQLYALQKHSTGSTFVNNNLIRNRLMGGNNVIDTGSGRITPSLDLEHYGFASDGKRATTPNLWLSYGRAELRVIKLAWTAPGWTAPASSTLLRSGITAQDSINGRFDGTYFLCPVPNVDDTDTVALYQRKKANNGTVLSITPAHPQGVIRNCAVNYDAKTGDCRVFAVGTTNSTLYYVDLVRSTGNWGSWVQLSATAILGTNANQYGAKRGAYRTAKHDVYAAFTTPAQTSFHNALAYPPGAPTWVNISGAAGDVGASLVLDWDFVDADPADTQSAYAVIRQIGAGSLNYWRASDSTWQVAEVKNTSATTSLTLASGWGTDGDSAHTYKVKVWDASDAPSVYGAGLIVLPSAKVNPTIDSPTAGQAWASSTVTIKWTVAEHRQHNVKLHRTGTGEVLHESGFLNDYFLPTEYTLPIVVADNLSDLRLTLTSTNNDGLASTPQTVDFSTDYVEPSLPQLTVVALPSQGVIRVAVANPASGPITFVNSGTGQSGDNVSLTPPHPAGLARGDLKLILASIRNSGTGTVDLPTGWTNLINFANVRLMGRIHVAGVPGVPDDVAPLVTFTGGAAGEDTLAQMAAFRGAALQAHATSTLLNASAQNIATPALTVTAAGQLILFMGWKQDDWTSLFLHPLATNSIPYTVSTAGLDAGQVTHYTIQTTAANLAVSEHQLVGGASAISRGMLAAVHPIPVLAHQDLWRREVGDLTDGIRIAEGLDIGVIYDDYTAISGKTYEYRVQAFGANQTSIYSPWTA